MPTSDPVEARSSLSSVEVSLNSKGEPSYHVKVYEGTDEDTLDVMVRQAVETLRKLIAAYGR